MSWIKCSWCLFPHKRQRLYQSYYAFNASCLKIRRIERLSTLTTYCCLIYLLVSQMLTKLFQRLNSLLLCSDLDIVLLSLQVLLRPAQQYSSQSSVTHVLSHATSRLLALAKRWPHLREYGVSLVDLVSSKNKAEIDGLPAEARDVSFSFYRMETSVATVRDKTREITSDTPATPPKSQAASVTGPINISISEATLQSQPAMNILVDSVRSHRVPEEEKFELLNRIRVSQALSKTGEAQREKLVIARLLAIAIYALTHTDSQTTATFFLYEPDLISNVAELLHVEYDVPIAVQTAAIAVLDSLTRYRNRCQEVLTAVNAGVNHGILMALFRKTVHDVANPSSSIPQSFIEALLQFVTLIATHTTGVNMVVGAGLIPLLIQLVENRLSNRLPVVSKTLQLIDSVLYSFQNGFSLFVAARGVSILVDRIEVRCPAVGILFGIKKLLQYEIDHDIQNYKTIAEIQDFNFAGSEPFRISEPD